MNAQAQILPLSDEPKPASAPVAPSGPAPDSALTAMHSSPTKRRTSKIARLPKKLRDLINERLSDGVAYDQIVLELNQSTDPPLPYEISARNLSDWFAGGYQDWLQHQERMEALAARFDFALELAQTTQPEKLQELVLQLATIRLCEFLSQLAIADPQTDPSIYLRLLSVLPRISRETVNLQKYRDTAAAQTQAANPAQPTSEADRVEAARNALLYQMDDILGLKSYHHRRQSPNAPAPISHFASAIPTTEAHGNPQKPTLADPTSDSSHRSDSSDSSEPSDSRNQNSKNQNQKSEFCLECHHPLPPLLPNGRRPSNRCPKCNFPLPVPGSCYEPSIERCLDCRINLPRVGPDGKRPDIRCHKCGVHLPIKIPVPKP